MAADSPWATARSRFTYDNVDRALAQARSFTESPARFQLLTVYEMRLHRKAHADLKQLRALQAERRVGTAARQGPRNEPPAAEARAANH